MLRMSHPAIHLCDLTLPDAASNLACDEALLDWHEAHGGPGLLRFWEPASPAVVVGYANQVAREVNLDYCRQAGIPVLRRCSGGGTVLQGAGCLNYALILPIGSEGPLTGIHSTNCFILKELSRALTSALGEPVARQGDTDLSIAGLKICGNAQRRRKDHLLFHGCFLLDLDLDLLERALPMPSREPSYRARRAHRAFVRNLHQPASLLKACLAEAWAAHRPFPSLPLSAIEALASDKYRREDWNLKF